MSHHPSRTNTWHARHATDSPTPASATSSKPPQAGPSSARPTAPTGTASKNPAGNTQPQHAHARHGTTPGHATAAPPPTHPSSDPTAKSAADAKASCHPTTAAPNHLLHHITAGHSPGDVNSKTALTSTYATPNFPSNPTPPDSGGCQEFFLDGSENFGGAAW